VHEELPKGWEVGYLGSQKSDRDRGSFVEEQVDGRYIEKSAGKLRYPYLSSNEWILLRHPKILDFKTYILIFKLFDIGSINFDCFLNHILIIT
jgi:hypothetical protein